MSFWSRLQAALRAGGWYGPYASSDPALAALFGPPPASSGIAVNETTALNNSIVWACVQLIAGTMATLPLMTYRRLPDGGKERMTGTRLYKLLHDQPNDDMPAATFLETLGQHVLLWGNAFAEIRRDARGQVAALWLIEPWRITWFRADTGEVRYRVDGQTVLRPEEMVHVPGLTPDGIWGYSPIAKARESLGLLMAAERFGGSFFANGSSFGGILTHPARLNETAEQKLRESLEKRGKGVERAHNFLILQEGMRYEKLGVPPNDAQYLEGRKFQISEIARWFGVPPHMVGDVERSTSWGTGIEQMTIGFVTYTLRRWLVRFEQEFMRKLISPLERNLQLIEFVVDGLLRGDTTTRYNAYQIGHNGGWLSPNDIRRLENMDPLGEQGDMYLVPLNMVPANQVQNNGNGTAPAEPDQAAALREISEDLQALRALGRAAAETPPMLPPPDLTPALEAQAAQLRELAEDLHALQALGRAAAETPPPAPPDLVPVMTPLLEKLEAVEAAQRAQAARMAATIPSLYRLIEDGVTELIKREVDRAQRAAGTPEKLAAWLEAFYPQQADYAVRKLGSAVELYWHLLGRAEDTQERIRRTMAQHTLSSTQTLRALLNTPPEALKAAVETLTAHWATERPSALTRALLPEEVSSPI